ncbi:MAG: hypothetical protein GF393_00185, partial [Armatimonadia bacterium]|nr:hypothetical protein [Armatimonadia bacterium]
MDNQEDVLRAIQEALRRIDGRLHDLDERVGRLEGEDAVEPERPPEMDVV